MPEPIVSEHMLLLLMFLLPSGVFIFGALWGRRIEKRHFADLARREALYRDFPVLNWRKTPTGYEVSNATMVSGGVVISDDAGKQLLARFKNFLGGNIRSYETLLERGRREARLRMLEQARSEGADVVINVRYDTADLTSRRNDQSNPVGIEVFVFGTALNLRKVDV